MAEQPRRRRLKNDRVLDVILRQNVKNILILSIVLWRDIRFCQCQFRLGELKNPEFDVKGDTLKVAYHILAIKAKANTNRNFRDKSCLSLLFAREKAEELRSLVCDSGFTLHSQIFMAWPLSSYPELTMQHISHGTVMCDHYRCFFLSIQPCVYLSNNLQ